MPLLLATIPKVHTPSIIICKRNLKNYKLKMVNYTSQLFNLSSGRSLYKYLMRECQKLPGDASTFYKHSVKQSFKQHVNESDPVRIKEIISRALEDADWVRKKYKKI